MQCPKLLRARRTGFTLLEMIVVLLIIAILAGLAIPIVNMLKRSAEMGASAKSQADLANNISLFFTLQSRYPQGMDSLLAGPDGTALYLPTPDNTNTQTSGLPASTITLQGQSVRLASVLTPTTITGNQRRSFTRAGFDFIHHHNTAALNANDSGTVLVNPLPDPLPVAQLARGTSAASAALYDSLLPSSITLYGGEEPNTMVIALGIGPRNTAIGKTITNCPTFPGSEGTYYGRYIAYFKLYGQTGERATLVGVTDAFGRTPDYTQQQFNESLPNGARQP